MAPYGPPQTQWSSGYYPMGMPQQPQPPMQQQMQQQPSQQQGAPRCGLSCGFANACLTRLQGTWARKVHPPRHSHPRLHRSPPSRLPPQGAFQRCLPCRWCVRSCLLAPQTDASSGDCPCAAGCPPGSADGACPGATAACPCADHAQGSDARRAPQAVELRERCGCLELGGLKRCCCCGCGCSARPPASQWQRRGRAAAPRPPGWPSRCTSWGPGIRSPAGGRHCSARRGL